MHFSGARLNIFIDLHSAKTNDVIALMSLKKEFSTSLRIISLNKFVFFNYKLIYREVAHKAVSLKFGDAKSSKL